MNRCLTEGRRSFLERYAQIESGAECERWLEVISAMVDGEATPERVVELRPHLRNCPGCRATLRALRDSSQPLGAVLPIPLAVAATPDAADQVANLFTRAYEIVVAGLHDRAVTSFTKVQTVVEATAAGKTAAIAGAAAAVAGGGYATVERSMVQARAERPAKTQRVKAAGRPEKESARTPAAVVSSRGRTSSTAVVPMRPRTARKEFEPLTESEADSAAPEFSRQSASTVQASSLPVRAAHQSSASAKAPSSPEFASASAASSSAASSSPTAPPPAPAPAPEFGP